jgi:hypothetical protein
MLASCRDPIANKPFWQVFREKTRRFSCKPGQTQDYLTIQEPFAVPPMPERENDPEFHRKIFFSACTVPYKILNSGRTILVLRYAVTLGHAVL